MPDPTEGPDLILAVLDGSGSDTQVLEQAAVFAHRASAGIHGLLVAPLKSTDLLSAGRRLQPWEQMRNQELHLERSATELVRKLELSRTTIQVAFGRRSSLVADALRWLDPITVVAAPRSWWRAGHLDRLRLERAAAGRLAWTEPEPQAAFYPDSRRLLRRHPLFAGVSAAIVDLAAANLDLVDVPAGRVLIHEGRQNPAFWLILEGRVEVSVAGSVRRVVGRGGFVGGFSLLSARPAVASVRTLAPVRALAASPAQFRFVVGDETVRLRLKAAYADRYRDDLAAALAVLG